MNGVLVVDKPEGPTSHDIVARVRRRFGTRQVGHAGTLDPMATGVLVVLIGQATKLSPYLTAERKRYRATVAFGRTTDSLDAQGQTTEERELAPGWLDANTLEQVLQAERLRREQRPPLFSAISVDGKRAHREARAGRSIELAARPVTVHELALIAADDASTTLELTVDKGYYVRSLARDVGEALGVPAHLSALRRLASGAFDLSQAASWPLGDPLPPLLDLAHAAQRAVPCAELTLDGAVRARHGKPLGEEHFEQPPPEGTFGWLSAGQLVAIGEQRGSEYRVLRGFSY